MCIRMLIQKGLLIVNQMKNYSSRQYKFAVKWNKPDSYITRIIGKPQCFKVEKLKNCFFRNHQGCKARSKLKAKNWIYTVLASKAQNKKFKSKTFEAKNWNWIIIFWPFFSFYLIVLLFYFFRFYSYFHFFAKYKTKSYEGQKLLFQYYNFILIFFFFYVSTSLLSADFSVKLTVAYKLQDSLNRFIYINFIYSSSSFWN